MPKQNLPGATTPAIQAGKRPRTGRPPMSEAGEVEERILDAATALFMEHGYEGVSFEQIASAAHAGKATIYARYANKDALFTAVIRKSIDRRLTLAGSVAGAEPPPDLLTHTLQSLLGQMLASETVSLTRVVIGEAPRFPSLAQLVDEFGRQRAIDIVWRVMVADVRAAPPTARRGRPPGKAAASQLLEQLYAPMMLRALVGEDLAAIQGQIPQRVADAVTRFRKPS